MSKNIHQQRILVIDFGSPLTQVVGRKVRQAGVFCEIIPFDAKLETLKNYPAKGLVFSGSEADFAEQAAELEQQLAPINVPVLKIATIAEAEKYTADDSDLLKQFALNDCGCDALWTAQNIIDDAIASVRKQVGDDHVILGLSGGVDSSVVAALLHKAIGDQLTCVFVDHGLLRLHEGDQVMQMFAENMGIKVIRANKDDLFLGRLAGVTDPEEKRKIIGNTFIEVFDEEAAKIDNAKWLAQGTIYPDIIESVGAKNGKAKVIKSHHNVGGLPEDMALKLIEPLRELFKDEVRKIGVELGLPYDMVYRHPFPGPGLGVRILGEIKKEYADVLRQADAIFIEELHKADWYHKTSQAFAVFNPVKSVGMVNDERRYAWVVVLRAVETIDFMTARWAHLPYELLETVSSRIITEIPEVSRVAYDISSKPPATIEWE